MVHPMTGEAMSSYKKLMHDPATAKIWQTTFGKDFGGMAQGNNKTGQRGTNAMFVMTHEEIQKSVTSWQKNHLHQPSGRQSTTKGGCKLDSNHSRGQFDQLR
jgi:hypothetical protein